MKPTSPEQLRRIHGGNPKKNPASRRKAIQKLTRIIWKSEAPEAPKTIRVQTKARKNKYAKRTRKIQPVQS